MTDATCSEPDCLNSIAARDLCRHHYIKLYRAGALSIAAPQSQHALSNVDELERTGDCAICGVGVRIRVRVRVHGTYIACRRNDRGKLKNRRQQGNRPAQRRWSRYGITEEEFVIRLQAQGGACLLCLEPFVKPYVDHDHVSGAVRGLLCQGCNFGLGWFRDNAEVLTRAAKYIRRYGA